MASVTDYTQLSADQVLSDLKSTSQGLTSSQILPFHQQYGLNELSSNRTSARQILTRQFKSSFIYLLIVAISVSLLLGQHFDALMIGIFITINTALGFIQEYRSEKTLQLLKQFTTNTTNVIRDKQVTSLPSVEIVPGDVIVLKTGDIIPADVRFITTQDLIVDESILTGESVPINKSSSALSSPPISIYRSTNLGFSGTSILSGEATAVVIAIGNKSELGSITRLATATKRESSFEKGINSYSRFILKLVIGTLILLFAANIIIKPESTNITELLLFSIALAVSVIPEALPVVITFSLSRGAAKLAKAKVVVKRLSAIEDLGSIQILCTDKTGTLTENHLTIKDIHSESSPHVLFFGALAGKSGNDPFDQAFQNKLSPTDKTKLSSITIIKDLPFDPVLRTNLVISKEKGHITAVLRGAPESVLSQCQLTHSQHSEFLSWVQNQGRQGHRVISLATKSLKAPLTSNISHLKDFTFAGLISFSDPIKASTFEAIKKAKKDGLQIKIITGDSPEVAGNVAQQIGLIENSTAVITGQQLFSLSPDQQQTEISKYSVFARIDPSQKYAIIQSLQRDNLVGFLGEGINDAPALKIANVGIVVQSASDVSRENADIILLQKNLLVIVEGIKQGRDVFVNTTKYLKSTLASNFGNFYAIAISSLLIPTLPMLPLQILLVNLLSDFPMIAIATDTVDPQETRQPEKYDIRQTVLLATILGLVSTLFDFLFFGLFFRSPPATLQTNWFIGSILTELVFIYSIRTRRPFFRSIHPSNLLLFLTSIAAAATCILPYLSFAQNFFKFSPPSGSHLFIIFSLVISYFLTSELAKIAFYKYAVK